MPYIAQIGRKSCEAELSALAKRLNGMDGGPGLLNYAITSLILRTQALKGYKDMNAVIGVLACCQLEVYRRVVAPYEQKKIEEAGDVY